VSGRAEEFLSPLEVFGERKSVYKSAEAILVFPKGSKWVSVNERKNGGHKHGKNLFFLKKGNNGGLEVNLESLHLVEKGQQEIEVQTKSVKNDRKSGKAPARTIFWG
jgi:hypothetical protein